MSPCQYGSFTHSHCAPLLAFKAAKQLAETQSAAETLAAGLEDDADFDAEMASLTNPAKSKPAAPLVLEERRKSFELPAPLSRWTSKAQKRGAGGTPACCPMVEKMVELSEKNSNHMAWSDLWFDEVLTNSDDVDEATGEVAPKCLDSVVQEVTAIANVKSVLRGNFRAWLLSVSHVAVPENAPSVALAAAANFDAESQVVSLDPLREIGRVDSDDQGKGGKRSKKPSDGGGDGPAKASSPWTRNEQLNAYGRLISEVPDHNVSSGTVLYCMVEAVVLTDEFGSGNKGAAAVAVAAVESVVAEEKEAVVYGPLGPGPIALDYGDTSGLRVALTEILLADGNDYNAAVLLARALTPPP